MNGINDSTDIFSSIKYPFFVYIACSLSVSNGQRGEGAMVHLVTRCDDNISNTV